MMKTPDELYRERLNRVEDAIQLKVPDRVPFFPRLGFFPARYAGLPAEEAVYRSDKWLAANKKVILELEPDIYSVSPNPGRSWEAMDCKQMQWPGHGGPADSPYQFVAGEYMKANEYDAFFDDPSDFLVRTYLPRVFGTLEPLRKLPSLQTLFMYGYSGARTSAVFAAPEMVQAFGSVYQAGIEAMKYNAEIAALQNDLKDLGFPKAFAGPNMFAPFDIVADMLRGMQGTMLDMYREPDRLLTMMDRIFPAQLRDVTAKTKKTGGISAIYIPLHFGADGFMSAKQFETFYWPGLKKLILGLIDAGLTPCPFLEGDFLSRLPYFTDLPKGKAVLYFDSTDLVKAKEIVGGTACIAGNMPLSLLQSGTPDQIREYSKRLIDIVGKGGGFIMTSRGGMDDANPELVKVWAEFTKEYGVYR